MAEHRFRKAGAEGSNPSIGSFFFAEHSPIGTDTNGVYSETF
jgi:hypothetical protein